MKYSFPGQSVLVTGAASGIGEATAHLLAANGLSVVVSDLHAKAVGRVVDAITADGGKAVANVADVARAGQVEAAVDCAVKQFGALHFAVNNAGIGGALAPAGALSAADWQRVIDINLSGVAHGLRYQVPAIIAAGGGAIVNMSSILGLVGDANAPAYVAAKHGVTGLTRSAALAYSSQGVRINSIHPGYVETPILDGLDARARAGLVGRHPIGRLGQPGEIAHAIAFLLSDGASFVTVVLVHVVEPMKHATGFEPPLIYIREVRPRFLAAGQALLDDAASRLARDGIATQTVLLESGPDHVAELIARQAEASHCDLVVMGTHGRRGVDRLVMGSGAERVARIAPVPVMLVRPPTPHRVEPS